MKNLLRELKVSGSSGRGRFALGGGLGPGFDGEVGKGWLSDGKSSSRFGREVIWSCDDPGELVGSESVGAELVDSEPESVCTQELDE